MKKIYAKEIKVKIVGPFSRQVTFFVAEDKSIILLKDGEETSLGVEKITPQEILKIFKNSGPFLVAKKNGDLVDLTDVIAGDCELEFLGVDSPEGLEVYRHTTAHVMAYAVKNLFPQAKLTIGPVIEGGFYYDVDDLPLKEEDFAKIETEMKKLIAKRYVNERSEVSKLAALELFKDNPYKIEIIKGLSEDEEISCYQMGDFVDLCRGPHIPHIGMIKAFKLQKLTGAYWRGKSDNKMLTRVYGTSFPSSKELKKHLTRLEELKASDHNKLGRELGFFISNESVGQGLPLLTPKGSLLKRLLENWVEEEETKRGYEFTTTPYLAKSDLYKISGHWEHYKENMFVIETNSDVLALRPMTCPFHFSLYNAKKRSYRELPIRYAENSVLFRNESSGEMHGLIRVRQFTLADGHIICEPSQVAEEFKGCLELVNYYLETLGLDDYYFRLSKWDAENPDKYVNDPVAWDKTEKQMEDILADLSLKYVEAVGEAAFYGPKLDVQMKNVHGKEDTIMTVQIDFALPKKFAMKYSDRDDQDKQPVVIHRGSLGCYERTIALLLEKYSGKLPFWLAPQQIEILSISDQVHEYALEVLEKCRQHKIRAKANLKNESLGKKIREGQKQKIPCLLILGREEKEREVVSLRLLNGTEVKNLPLEKVISFFKKVEAEKSKELVLDDLHDWEGAAR